MENPSRACGWSEVGYLYGEKGSPILPGEGRKEKRGGHCGCRWSLPTKKEIFSFSGAFKIYTTPWEGRPRRFPPNNEWVDGAWMVPSQVRVAIPRAMSPKLFLFLDCLNFTCTKFTHFYF
jgi:hypothetical protein